MSATARKIWNTPRDGIMLKTKTPSQVLNMEAQSNLKIMRHTTSAMNVTATVWKTRM